MQRQSSEIGAGRYRLIQQLGRGGMGSVWRAEDRNLGSHVAIKLLDPTLAQDEGARERFRGEAQAAAALRSPHIVQIFDHGVDQGVPFIAMELLEGETLGDRLTRARVLAPAEANRIFSDVARAIRKAHDAGIIHRDLKPDNIFLVRNDDQEVTKVLDFGIAKSTSVVGGARVATQTGALIGTLPYMSPEQAQGAKAIDYRSDLWSLAVIAFECVCGRLPFESEHQGELVLQICARPIPVPSHLAPVPPGFDAWFAKAASRDPEERFRSAKEQAVALTRVLTPSSAADIEGPSSSPAERGDPFDPAVDARSAVATINGGATIDRSATVVRGAARREARGAPALLPWLVSGAVIAAAAVISVLLWVAPGSGRAASAAASSAVVVTGATTATVAIAPAASAPPEIAGAAPSSTEAPAEAPAEALPDAPSVLPAPRATAPASKPPAAAPARSSSTPRPKVLLKKQDDPRIVF